MLGELCPRLAVLDGPGAAPRGDGRVVWSGWALVRVHASVDAADGRPLRWSAGPEARVVPVAAGAGPVVLTDRGVAGVVRAAGGRPALAYQMAWSEIDDVGPARAGGVRLLSTTLLGALTLDPVR